MGFNFSLVNTFLCHSTTTVGCLTLVHHCVNLSKTKHFATKHLHPYKEMSHNCTLLLLSNIAQPEWISISCHKQLIVDVLSVPKVKNDDTIWVQFDDVAYFCPSGCISRNKTCFLFHWCHYNCSAQRVQRRVRLHVTNMDSFVKFEYLFRAISANFPSTIAPINKSLMTVFTVEKVLERCIFRESTRRNWSYGGFMIFLQVKHPVAMGENVLKCQSNVFISYRNLCNNVENCPGKNYLYKFYCLCKLFLLHKADNLFCSNKTLKGQFLHLCYSSKNRQCLIFLPNEKQRGHRNPAQYPNELHLKKDHNVIVDTDLFESLPMLLGQNNTFLHKFLCESNHDKDFFSVSDICNYKLNEDGHIVPCKNGAHLEFCKTYECNAKYKCNKSYCIPWAYVCDGVWHCPEGDDESYKFCGFALCQEMFKCGGVTHICIHMSSLCDGQIDCPLGEDEDLCELHVFQCPVTCICFALAVLCKNSARSLFLWHQPYLSVSVFHTTFDSFQSLLDKIPRALFITCENCKIKEVCNNKIPKGCVYFGVSHNSINHLKNRCFYSIPDVTLIFLVNNDIVFVETFCFIDLENLRLVNLSNNPVVPLPAQLLIEFRKIHIVSLINTKVILQKEDELSGYDQLILEGTDYHLCCIRSIGKCTSPPPWYRPCSDLLISTQARISFLTMAVLLLVVNLSALLVYLWTRIFHVKPFMMTAVCISINDLTLASYILVLCVSDYQYGDSFSINEEIWRSSFSCFMAFGLGIVFFFSSQSVLLFLSSCRFVLVKYPFKTSFKRSSFAVKCLGYMYVATVIFGLTNGLLIAIKEKHLPEKLCWPFFNPTGLSSHLKRLTVLGVAGQFLSVCITTFLHLSIVFCLKNTHKLLDSFKSKKKSLNGLFWQLLLSQISSTICWVPANIIYLMIMYSTVYSERLTIFTILLIVPITSLSNPTLLSVTSIRKMLDTQNLKRPRPGIVQIQ